MHSKLEIRGGKETEKHRHPQEKTLPPEKKEPAVNGQAKKSVLAPITEQELRSAWEKLESYHPLTEQALGEVLSAFLAGRG